MSRPPLHILEPTLINDAGHCFTICRALAEAAAQKGMEVRIWAGRRVDPGLIGGKRIRCIPHFDRALRRPQLHLLLRRLLRGGERILVPTAGRPELLAFALLPERLRRLGLAYFYVHQMRMEGNRFRRLQRIARRAPETPILTTTEALAEAIGQAGFRTVACQPCPFTLPEEPPKVVPFRQLIFPGVARMDKNLPLIAELIALLQRQRRAIPFLLQAGPNHHGEYAADVATLLERIRAVGYPHLTMPGRTLEGKAYFDQFPGAICLQPYRVREYADKISGITLDALARGCPVIVRAGIQPAGLVARFDAGVVIDSDDAACWLDAIDRVIADYVAFQRRCSDACAWLREHHSATALLDAMERMA
ncbi:MAG: glycosyltransferase family 1 protein [Zetaproteobacteria bacterium]|nr:MAG: glycosyltransferase family 1 protein [Zetaproteobacteria bacterium]